MKAFVDFYKQEKISPVSQDISDLEKHFRRRNALYRHLGIVPAFVRGRRVLEFGPGSGHNSVHTASLEPGEYVLVEANPTGIANMRALFEEHSADAGRLRIVESYIEDFQDENRFDLVLCEGLLPTQERPADMLRHVGSFTAPGGVLAITCIDAVSYLAEQLRRLAASLLTGSAESPMEKVAILLPIFSPHLATIDGMSRPHEEWILDNIVQPFQGGRLFGLDEAIDALEDTHSFYSTSPRFITDWRWYKKITGGPREFNDWGRQAYFANLHNFLDSRTSPVPGESSRNLELLERCGSVFADIIAFDTSRDEAVLARLTGNLEGITRIVELFSAETGDSLRRFLGVIEKLRRGEVPLESDWGSFAGFFGQGQQYASFIRN